ncbi:DUF1501 domain-containing protein [Gimesia aquarii]|uniref:DUF1501 domain-containing protein n=1 Tax=Gimesia aquarii TaxID=2527964 RepID=A0A517VXV4_9PLAN|nr:DUF1501 domain-containing protein [Gimesia aquarii]QDT97836.1 hypothetical protein V144x_33180 [Gimesia aquarii]
MKPSQSIFCPGPMSRRSFFEAGYLALGGLGLSDLLLRRAMAKATNTQPTGNDDTAVIFIWLLGGPSHMETYDMKPDAPSDYRGQLNPIATSAPGIDICELLPKHAKVADRFSIIRSISHEDSQHARGSVRFLSGRKTQSVSPISEFPTVGPIVSRMREHRRVGVPNYVASSARAYGGGSAYLGESAMPFVVGGNPGASGYTVPNLSLSNGLKERLDDRVHLLKSFDHFRRDVDLKGSMESMDEINQQALSLLTSDKAREAFDLSRESDATRDRYGRHKWGQRALLARRLVEAGSSFVTMYMNNPDVPGTQKNRIHGNWDIHAINGDLYYDLGVRLPHFDSAVSALIEDLYDRGLDKKVMLIVSGEFGRTPRITVQPGTRSKVMQPGRDHWPGAMSVLVSGGGAPMGQVIGSTTSKGEYAKDNKLDPNDLLSTIYRFLGIDQHHEFLDRSGRPMPILPHGTPIRELS